MVVGVCTYVFERDGELLRCENSIITINGERAHQFECIMFLRGPLEAR